MADAPQIITRTYDFILYLLPQVSKFPRSERYLIGERLESLSFDVLEILLEACYSKEKSSLLSRANIKLEQARYYIRLCKDLKLTGLHGYEVLSKKVDEIGVQLGGWLKQQKGRG